MPQSVVYTARRSLVTGHVASTQYSLNLYVTAKDRERVQEGAEQIALSGKTYTTYHRGDVMWHIQTRPLSLTETRLMREFLDSAEDGQVIEFDPTYWAGSSPSDRRSAVLQSRKYREKRTSRGGDQTADTFAFTFTLREL